VIADRILAGDETAMDNLDGSRLDFLRWLAEQHAVLFHGSGRGDLTVLEPIRLTRDASPFGDQQAVFAASDPVWAIYFAILRRGDGFRSTRNGSIGFSDALYPRWYWFSHNEEATSEGRFGNGWLYVLPQDSFEREPLGLGVFDAGQWASPVAVRPLAQLPVSADDFPFADRVVSHRPGQAVFRTILRAAGRGRWSAVAHGRRTRSRSSPTA
jgi:hypothetical protein